VRGPGESAVADTPAADAGALDDAPPDLDLIPDSIDLENDDP
jgi:hypothetical protein